VPTIFKYWPGDGEGQTIQRAGWETTITLDELHRNEEAATLDSETVFCLLVCVVEPTFRILTYYLVLRKEDQTGQYKCIGIGHERNVYAIEDCERSTEHRPALEDAPPPGMNLLYEGDQIRSRPIMDEWFKDAEEQEITLI
jgi:hypothetical protein